MRNWYADPTANTAIANIMREERMKERAARRAREREEAARKRREAPKPPEAPKPRQGKTVWILAWRDEEGT